MPYGESGKPGSSTSGQSSHDRGGRQHQATAAKHERRTIHHPGGGAGGTYKPTHVKPGLGPERQTKSILDYSLWGQLGKAAHQGLQKLFKPKTEKEKSEQYTKKGFDILNPNEMRSAKYKPVVPPGGGEGQGAYVTPITLAAASTPKTPPISQRWNFQAYEPTSTAHTRLYGKKGKMVKANQGEFSKGKRFGPPPKKGPDPQGLNVPLNSVNYFKDLL